MRWNSAANGGPAGKSWGKSSLNGYPFHTLFMSIRTRDFTPAAMRRHIQSKNRVRQRRQHGSVRGCVKNAFFKARCCIRDEGGPFGAGWQEQAPNSRKLLSSHGGGGERYGKGVRKSRHVWVRETNASEPLMRPRNRPTEGIKTGAPPLSGKSMAETWLLAMRCPGYRWRDSSLGSGMELENLFDGDKGKGTIVVAEGGSSQWMARAV